VLCTDQNYWPPAHRRRAIYPTRGCCSIESKGASHTFFGVHPRRAPEKQGRRAGEGHQERRNSRAKSSVLLVGLKYWMLPKVRSRCLIAHMCCMCRWFLPLPPLQGTRSGRHIRSWDSARAPTIMFLAVFHAATPAHPFSPLFAGPADPVQALSLSPWLPALWSVTIGLDDDVI
jgi:hypothetical protein